MSRYSECDPRCKVGDHPQIDDIDEAIMTGSMSQEKIATTFGGITQNNVSNHKKHLRPDAQEIMVKGDSVGVIAQEQPQANTPVRPEDALTHYSAEIRRLQAKAN